MDSAENQEAGRELKKLAQFPTEAEANLLVAFLSERGIPAQAVGGYTAGFIAEAPGLVSVLVRRIDLEAAATAKADFSGGSDVDWDNVDVGVPEDLQ